MDRHVTPIVPRNTVVVDLRSVESRGHGRGNSRPYCNHGTNKEAFYVRVLTGSIRSITVVQ